VAIVVSLLPAFLDNVLVQSSRVKHSMKNATAGKVRLYRDGVSSDWFARKVMGASWIVAALRRTITRVSYGEIRMQDVSWSSLKQPPGECGKEKEDIRERRIMVGTMNQTQRHREKLEDWKEGR